ncbi:hypothetical protein [Hydrogenophaga sp. ANAO-22]|uniref:hypothetical protein n=1 Tax=Hydrogenophaga sp. ANAO-22 TaxID=3166645 RepID=UPI0036D2652A
MATTTKPPAVPVQVLPQTITQAVDAASKLLIDRLAVIATEIHARAVEDAGVKVDGVMKMAAEQRETADRELADAGQAVEDMEAKVDSMQAALDEHVAMIEGLRQELAAKGLENAQLTERVAQLVATQTAADKQHAAALHEHKADHQVEVNELRRELAEVRKAAESQLGARAALEHQVWPISSSVRPLQWPMRAQLMMRPPRCAGASRVWKPRPRPRRKSSPLGRRSQQGRELRRRRLLANLAPQRSCDICVKWGK